MALPALPLPWPPGQLPGHERRRWGRGRAGLGHLVFSCVHTLLTHAHSFARSCTHTHSHTQPHLQAPTASFTGSLSPSTWPFMHSYGHRFTPHKLTQQCPGQSGVRDRAYKNKLP